MTVRLLAMLSLLDGRTPEETDSCALMLPSSLRQTISRQYPGRRLPRESDSNPEYVRLDRERGGSGCVAAAQGDFNLDTRQDLAFLATAEGKVFLMVALAEAKGWDVEDVWQVGDVALRSGLYVAASKPGKYEDLGSADGTGSGSVPAFTCDSQVVIAGMDGTGVAFCKTTAGWLHVWVPE